MLAREKPHCGVSGVPFMNNTTEEEDIALSIAIRVSLLKYRVREKGRWRLVAVGGRKIEREAYRIDCGDGGVSKSSGIRGRLEDILYVRV